MSAVPQPITPEATTMRVTVRGRIERSRSHNGTRYTVITCPAPDAYSRPSTVQVRSKQQLGSSGDEITIRCTLSGYLRRFSYVDRDSGEKRQGDQCDLTLDAIE